MSQSGYGREHQHMDKHYAASTSHHAATDSGANGNHPDQRQQPQHTQHRPQHSQQQQYHASSASLPTALPPHVYSTSQTTWTAQELHLLHKGLTTYPSERYDNITRCIKIAATIPDKCIRDVASKIRSIHMSQAKQAMHSDQRHMHALTAPLAALSSKRQKRDNNDMHMVPLTIKKEPTVSLEDSIRKGLQENDSTLHSMRANLSSGQLRSNLHLMAQFRDTCNVIVKRLGAMCSAVPPLPVHLDMSLLQAPPSPVQSLPQASHSNQDDI
ncbi:hypothetical protein, variant 2 [Aphanomyces invadans]|uniref:Myb-like domain-containing protein n=1 Tax=Aphanomyces invadans TaxID=157072 RepID=A0A024TG25_9STRA|nr:hypothetical protein, variant 2 [Aphanomyces invadans]ETV93120.1 hypothetical protein, variant 2 [Aphanomyces invadans]|eukprot:XP_008878141.1 hypothetical protein, variant 2 [Aphanomyces invadans]